MNPILKNNNTASWKSVQKLTPKQPELDYNLLKMANDESYKDLVDMRNTEDKEMRIKDIDEISKQSRIPLPGFVDSEDDMSSETYAPHSDWMGPSGNAWIGK